MNLVILAALLAIALAYLTFGAILSAIVQPGRDPWYRPRDINYRPNPKIDIDTERARNAA